MSGTFVISLDFELMWGVRDHRGVKDYGDAILGGRAAIPEMLRRFENAGIRATWAVVGLLFAKNRDEMLEFAPEVRPRYRNAHLSPYSSIENRLVGESERDDPLHFGASLIERIADTPGQEIATHTYSHYYCMEPGQDMAAFDADMDAALAIARLREHKLRSIVFPRNQYTPAHVQHVSEKGIDVYRGSANGWLYRSRSGEETTPAFRLVRFVDGALPLTPKQVVRPKETGQAIDIPASRFFRPWSRKLGPYNELHLRRIQSEMKSAARSGGIFHLWWHPHNLGRNPEMNIARLDRIIGFFENCRENYGMRSLGMQELASRHSHGQS